MKTPITTLLISLLLSAPLFADDVAEMTFEKKTHNFGIVAQDTCVVSCTFTFTNTGTAPLVIHQAYSTCGCTVPQYSQEPVAPGEKGELLVTYNGRNKHPGVFKKTITIHCNAPSSPVRIYIEGEMIGPDNIEELVTTPPAEPQVVTDTPAVEEDVVAPDKPKKNWFKRLFQGNQRKKKTENETMK